MNTKNSVQSSNWYLKGAIKHKLYINSWAKFRKCIENQDVLDIFLKFSDDSCLHFHQMMNFLSEEEKILKEIPKDRISSKSLSQWIERQKNIPTFFWYWIKQYKKMMEFIHIHRFEGMGLGFKIIKTCSLETINSLLFGVAIPIESSNDSESSDSEKEKESSDSEKENPSVISFYYEDYVDIYPGKDLEKFVQKCGCKEKKEAMKKDYFLIGWLSLVNHCCFVGAPHFQPINNVEKQAHALKLFKVERLEILKLGFKTKIRLFKEGSQLFANYHDPSKKSAESSKNLPKCKCPKCQNMSDVEIVEFLYS